MAIEEGYISLYVWPADQTSEDEMPEDFYNKVKEVLEANGIAWESI